MIEITMLKRGTASTQAAFGADPTSFRKVGYAKIISLLQAIPHDGNSSQSIAEGSKRLFRFVAR